VEIKLSKKNTFTRRAGGFTLAESILSIVILSVASAAVLLPFTGGTNVREEGVNRTLAAKLAADLIEQIVVLPFDLIVSSYDGYSESIGGVKDASGNVLVGPRYARFSRDAGCQYVYVAQESDLAEPGFILVTVRVYYDGLEMAQVSRLVSDG